MMNCSKSIVEGSERFHTPELIHRKIEKNISDGCAEETAIVFNNSRMEIKVSYQDMNSMANQIARFLITKAKVRSCSPNTDNDWLIGICMPPSEHLIIAILAILKTGSAYLPLEPNFPMKRIEHIVNEAKPIMILYDKNHLNWDPVHLTSTIMIECSQYMSEMKNLPNENVKSHETLGKGQTNLALVEYTSGSTGLPKGVRISHTVVMNRLKWQFEAMPFARFEKIGAFKTVLSFIDSVMEIWGPLFTDRAVLVIPSETRKDPSKLVQILEDYKVNRLIVVPTLLKSILTYLQMDSSNKRLQQLTLWTATSETLTPQLCLDFYEYFDESTHVICNLFGTTESGGDFLYYIIEGKKHVLSLDKIPIGYPIFNTIVYILDEHGQPVQQHCQGELYVSGLNLAESYVNGREKERFTANPFSKNPIYSKLYRTGDYACVNHERVIQYEGRTDTQVKVRGHRINLREIEMQANEIDGVKQAVVLAHHAGKEDQSILCFAIIDAEKKGQLSEQDIEMHLRKSLVDYMIPNEITCIDHIPLTMSGKTDRQTLLSIHDLTKTTDDHTKSFNFEDVAEDDIPKATILYETIIEITKFSSPNRISMCSNFYDIGGDSLNSILVIAELKRRGYVVNVSDFLGSKNLKDILMWMQCKSNEIVNEKVTTDSIIDKMKLKTLSLSDLSKDEGVYVLSECFFKHSELDKYADTEVTLRDYMDTFDPLWNHASESELSFALKAESGQIAGILIAFEAREHFDIPLVGGVKHIVHLCKFLEAPFLETIPGDQKVLLSYLTAINSDLSPAEKVGITDRIYAEVIRASKEREFYGILETNISSLTQQLAQFNGFKTVNKIRVNQFKYDNHRPYAKAPDTYEVTCDFLQL